VLVGSKEVKVAVRDMKRGQGPLHGVLFKAPLSLGQWMPGNNALEHGGAQL
jgi:hypothetical protein